MLHRDHEPLPLAAARRERRVGALDAQRDVAADERERRVRPQHARQQPGLAEDLEAVADPEHEAAVGGERANRGHHRARSARSRRSAGSRRTRSRPAGRPRPSPRAAPPPRARRATPRRRAPSAPRRASRSSFEPGKTGSTATRGLSLRAPRPRTTLDQRVREQLLAHRARRASRASSGRRRLDARGRRRGRRARPSTAKPSWRSELLDRLALRVEDARLRPDQHGRPHAQHAPPGRRGSRRTRCPVSRSNAST